MIDLKHGDCLELMKDIPDRSVDLILADSPYTAIDTFRLFGGNFVLTKGEIYG